MVLKTRPVRVDKRVAGEVVRKTWLLFCQWQTTQFGPDEKKYLAQRLLAERAVALLPEKDRKDYELP